MDLLIKGGRVIDPITNRDGIYDVLIQGTKINDIRPDITIKASKIIDASDKIVVPGLIDAHVHVRQFSRPLSPPESSRQASHSEQRENIYSVSRAAAKGGFTTIICEPNTEPHIDTPMRLKSMLKQIDKESIVNIYPSSHITKGEKGEKLVDIGSMKEAGAVKITDDGDPVVYQELMCEALKEAKKYNLPVSSHCGLSNWAESILKTLGNNMIDSELGTNYFYNSELFFVRRDIKLSNKARCPIHIDHVSLKASVDEIRQAKSNSWAVTAEATPHHFILTKDAEKKYGTDAKVNPPLRGRGDVNAIIDGLIEGTIDIIASDHAPHRKVDKDAVWQQAPFGIIGLETTVGLVLTELVHKGILSLPEVIAKLTINPARIFKLKAGSLAIGMPADITIIDLEKEWQVDVDQFESRGCNCPFNGWTLKGKAVTTIVKGNTIMEDEQIVRN